MFELPLLNTVILLSSGACTCACATSSRPKLKKNDFSKLRHKEKVRRELLSKQIGYLQYRGFTATARALNSSILPFSKPRVHSSKRIGPHNYEILCIFIGSLLGDGSIEKSVDGYRFVLYQKGDHIEYLLWLHRQFFKHGYCKENLPQIKSRKDGLPGSGKIVYYCRFRSLTYSSFYWIYEGFYGKGKKAIPSWIGEYLSPIAIAIWIMDDGTWIKNRGVKLCTDCFSLSDVKILVNILETKYGLKASIVKAGSLNQYGIYLPKSNLSILKPLILPYLHPYFYYKVNIEVS